MRRRFSGLEKSELQSEQKCRVWSAEVEGESSDQTWVVSFILKDVEQGVRG